jgi:hypothetical protein
MVAYYIFYGFVFLLLSAAGMTSGAARSLFVWIVFGGLFIFSGIRGSVGIDTFQYMQIYELIDEPGMFWLYLSKKEPLFVVFTYFHKIIFDSIVFYFASISFIQTALLYFVYKKAGRYLVLIFFYVLIVYFEMHFNTLRAGLAALLLALSLLELSLKRKVVLFILAGGFHFSVFLFAPLVVASLPGSKTKRVLISIGIVFLAAFVVVYFDAYLAKKAGDYFGQADGFKVSYSGFLFIVLLILSLLLEKKADFLYFLVVLYLVGILAIRNIFPVFYRFFNVALLLYIVFGLRHFKGNKGAVSALAYGVYIILLFLNGALFVSSIIYQKEKYDGSVVNVDFLYDPYEFYFDDPYF